MRSSLLKLTSVATGLIATLLTGTNAWAIGFTFTKVADTNTLIPGRTELFGGFGNPDISNGIVAFSGGTSSSSDKSQGVFKFLDGELSIVADFDDLPPENAFPTRPYTSTSISGETIIFSYIASSASGAPFSSPIYASVGSELELLFEANTQSSDVLPRSFINSSQIDGEKVLFNSGKFFGSLADGTGLSILVDGEVIPVVSDEDPVPNDSGIAATDAEYNKPFPNLPDGFDPNRFPSSSGSGTFDSFLDPYLKGNTVVFYGVDERRVSPYLLSSFYYDVSSVGVYTSVNGILSTVAAVKLPLFNSFPAPVFQEKECYLADSVAGEETIAFVDPCGGGVYLGNSDGLTLVANKNTVVPDTTNSFESVGSFSRTLSIDRNNVVFGAFGNAQSGSNFSGLYTNLGGELSKVVASGDLLDGKTVQSIRLTSQSISGDEIVFPVAFEDGTGGIYVAQATSSIPEARAIAGLLGVAMLGIARWRKRES